MFTDHHPVYGRVLLLVVVVLALLTGCGRPPLPTPIPTAPPPGQAVQPTAAPQAPAPTTAMWWNDRVFYEVFVRSFNDSNGDGIGDLPGLIEKLDYLNDGDPTTTTDLGVTGIWLMPVAQSPSYHGYDVTDYYTVEQDYGTNEDFKQLMTAAHARGIHVIVDLVLNHTSTEHPWFVDAASGPDAAKRDWYRWSASDDGTTAPWTGGGPVWHRKGDAYYFAMFWEGMPDLNYANPAVTAEMENVARYWLEEMGADGFRLDAVRHLVEEGTIYAGTAANHQWLAGFDDFMDSVDPEALTVGEVWDTTSEVVKYINNDELDLAFEFDLAEDIVTSVQRGEPVFTAQELAGKFTSFPAGQFATFLTNHDQPRVATTLFKDPEGNKLAGALLLTLPGVPFIYYGEEIGMTGNKPDEKIRTPMQWTDAANAGFTTGTPWQAVNSDVARVNVATEDADPASQLNRYRQLIHTRATTPALLRGNFTPVVSSCASTLAFLRQVPAGDAAAPEGQSVLVVLNFARKGEQSGCTFSYTGMALATGQYTAHDLLTDSDVAALTVAADGFTSYAPVETLAPREVRILHLQP
ncbi:MAG: alpha-amylase family glycosyl hydrolase [Anaerolineae bacterium]